MATAMPPARGRAAGGVLPVLHEVRDQDADDEGGLEAFTQADEVVGEHGRLRRRGPATGPLVRFA